MGGFIVFTAKRLVLAALWTIFLRVAARAQSTIPIPDYVQGYQPNEIVLNAPYSARTHFTSTRKLAEGKTAYEDEIGSEARDSQGRTYNASETHWTYLKGTESVVGTETLYRIEDFAANTTVRWNSLSKEAKVIHWPSSLAPADTDCSFCGTPDLPNKKIEKLGDKVIQGLRVEGTRMSYTIPADAGHNGEIAQSSMKSGTAPT